LLLAPDEAPSLLERWQFDIVEELRKKNHKVKQLTDRVEEKQHKRSNNKKNLREYAYFEPLTAISSQQS
jgi:hypothetical protein